MTPATLTGLFLFVLAAVTAAGYLVVLRPTREDAADAQIPIGISRENQDLNGPQAALVDAFRTLGEVVPAKANQQFLAKQLVAAGYRWPSAVSIFLGIKSAGALLFGIAAAWAAMIYQSDLSAAALAAVCGGGFGYMIPDRILDRMAHARDGHAVAASRLPWTSWSWRLKQGKAWTRRFSIPAAACASRTPNWLPSLRSCN